MRKTPAFVLRHLKENPTFYLTPNQTKNARSKRWYTFESDEGGGILFSCVGTVSRKVLDKLVDAGKLWRIEADGKIKYVLSETKSSFINGTITVPATSLAYQFLEFHHGNMDRTCPCSDCEIILAQRLNKIRQQLNG